MAWYKTGTVNLTNGSAAVVGVGTAFIANVDVGEGILLADGRLYEVQAVTSDTSLTLGTPYLGTSASGAGYVIAPISGYVRDLAHQAATLVQNYSQAYANRITGVAGYTGNVTIAQLLTALKTVDGAGSGLDADLLDGMNAASANTASAVVSRDASGNFAAGTITAALAGNASTATKLATARTINGVSFDGSANITIADSTKIPTTEKGAANGVATLDANGKVVISQIPDSIQQSGQVTIQNRGVITGCALTKNTSVARHLDISGGKAFAKGQVYRVYTKTGAASVPVNETASTATVKAYLMEAGDGHSMVLGVTSIGGNMPDNAIHIYNVTIPANHVIADITAVTLTSVSRIEPSFPVILNNEPNTYIALPKNLKDGNYQVEIEVLSASGAPAAAKDMLVFSRASNGFNLKPVTTADNIVVNWTIKHLNP